MDLNSLNHSHDSRRRYNEMQRESQSESTDRVRGARHALARLTEVRAQRLREERARAHEAHAAEAKHHAPDKIEISDRARVMAREHEYKIAHHGEGSARAERVAELKTQHEHGKPNSPEAIERAAENMLRHHE